MPRSQTRRISQPLFARSLALALCIMTTLISGCGRSKQNSGSAAAITIGLTSPSLAAGATMQLKATVQTTSGGTTDITSQVSWSSSNPQAASVSASGLVTAIVPGNTVLSASASGLTGSAALTVTAAALSTLAVSPQNVSVPVGLPQRFTALGSYENGATADLSAQVTWSVSPASVAIIDSTGLLSALASGSFTVTALSGTGLSAISGSAPGTVTAAIVTAIRIAPSSPSLASGTSQQLQASALLSNGTTQDVTSTVQWQSSSATVATVSSTGLLQAKSAGNARITATIPASGSLPAVSSFIDVSVTSAALVSIAISPANPSITAGGMQQFTATGSYSDGSQKNLSSTILWSSSNTALLSVDTNGLATAHATGAIATATLTATLGTVAQTINVTVQPNPEATVTGLAVVPTSARIAAGTPEKLTAYATYADGSIKDVSTTVNWSTSNGAFATVDSTGLVTGVSPGTATLQAQLSGFTGQTTIIVSPATLVSVALNPSSASFALGTSQQFHIVGTFSDGTRQDLSLGAIWTSSAPGVASISNTGLALAVGVGAVQLAAGFGGQTATTTAVQVTAATLVAVALIPNSPNLHAGTRQQLQIIGSFSDGSTQDISAQAAWSSSDSTVVSISATGLAVALHPGSVQLSGTVNGLTASSATFTVSSATLVSMAITPLAPSFALGTTQQFTVVGTYSDGTTQDLSSQAIWSSSNPQVATIDQKGLAKSGIIGSVQISATFGGITTTTGTVQVTPATLLSVTLTAPGLSLGLGTSGQFTLTGTFSDGTTQNLTNSATFISSNPASASVSATGLVTALALGNTTITGSYGGQSSSASLTISAAILVSIAITPSSTSIPKGATQQFTTTGTFSDGSTQDVSSLAGWSSSNTAVISVNASGLATGTGLGSAALTASYLGQTTTTGTVQGVAPALVAIQVTAGSLNIAAGLTQQLTALGTLSDGSTLDLTASVNWSSSNASGATVSISGLVLTISTGPVTLTAQSNGISGSITLTVTPAILLGVTIAPGVSSIAKGSTLQFLATAHYSDGSFADVTAATTWLTSVTSVASVSSTGLVSGLNGGSSQVWGTFLGQTSIVSLTVSPAALVSLAVTPSTVSLANGTAQAFHAIGTMTDGGTQDLTTSVTWGSSNGAIATVSSLGVATGTGIGSTTISAQAGASNAAASLNVTSATAVSLQLTPSTVILPAGSVQQLLITAAFTDGSSQNVTTSVTFFSSNPAVASVSALGLLQAHTNGAATIAVTLGAATYNLSVTVTAVTLQSLAIMPATLSLAAGISQQLSVIGTFSDGSTSDLTSSVTWSSSADANATVSTTGNLTAAVTGSATIAASTGGVSATLPLTITAATITSITVSPGSITLAAGQTQQLFATATLSDGTQQSITASANWSVSDPSKSSISNILGLNGFLTATLSGSVTVSASLNGVTGSASLTIQPATLTSLTITPDSLTLALGTVQLLTVTGNYSDGSTANMNASTLWSSSNVGVASISIAGIVIVTGTGSATLTANVQGVSAVVAVNGTSAALNSIALTAATTVVNVGEQAQFTAIGSYSDSTTADITTLAHWSSSNVGVATIDANGLVTTHGTGSTTITGSLNGVTNQRLLLVNAATLASIAVQASQGSFALGTSLQLTAIGTYSDGSTADLTSVVNWASLTPAVGIVNLTGLASGAVIGGFSARASLGGVSGSLSLTVSSAVLQSITITPSNSIVINLFGNSLHFVATGHFSDGSTAVLGTGVHWSISSGVAVASVSQAGILTPIALGLGTVTASYSGVSGSTGFTVVAL